MPGTTTVVDLFCGAGGLSCGLVRAGFTIVAAYDNWKPAVDTYRHNFEDHFAKLDITDDLTLPRADVIVGGPPCQGFSSAGRRRGDDHRNTLVGIFSTLVQRHKPKAFIFENVEGFLTNSRGRFVFDLLEPVIAAGYRVHLQKINAANFGVPQHRKRVIAIGGLGWDPPFPHSTHSAFGAPGADLGGCHLPETPSFADAVAGLPPAIPLSNSDGSTDHVFVPLRDDDLQRAKLLRQGQRMRDLPEELWHPSYRRRAYRRVMDGTPTERRGGAPAGVRRLCAGEPSKAITGGALREFFHPTEHRPLTVRECARLQTFPDDFSFPVAPRHAIQLIGNAIPPLLGERLAATLGSAIQTAKPEQLPGALLSFIPTFSTGMSPVLDAVTKRVKRRFLSHGNAIQKAFQWT